MHRADVDNPVGVEASTIALQRHATSVTTARRVALHAFAHRAEVVLARLTRLPRRNTDRVIAMMLSATEKNIKDTARIFFIILVW